MIILRGFGYMFERKGKKTLKNLFAQTLVKEPKNRFFLKIYKKDINFNREVNTGKIDGNENLLSEAVFNILSTITINNPEYCSTAVLMLLPDL